MIALKASVVTRREEPGRGVPPGLFEDYLRLGLVLKPSTSKSTPIHDLASLVWRNTDQACSDVLL